ITGNYRVSNETFSVANAGLERVISWISTNYTPQPPSIYSITPLGVKYGSSDVTFKGIPVDGTVPASHFPKADITNSFLGDFSEYELIIGSDNKDYGRYSVDAKMLSIRTTPLPFGGTESIERWQVDIKAAELNSSPASQITALIEVGTPAFFGYAIKADE